jgi:hypothetical protein
MSTGDSIFVYSVCGGVILLPILGLIGVFIAGIISRRNAKQQIAMEGSTFTETLAGDLIMEGNTWRNSLIVGFFGASLLVMVIGLVTASDRDRLLFAMFTLVWGLMTVPTIWRLTKALLEPRYRFSVTDRQLFIRQGRKLRALGFGELAGLKTTGWQSDYHGRYTSGTFYWGRLELTLKDGEVLKLGLLTGSRDTEEVLARCRKMTGLITRMTGLPATELVSAPSVPAKT